MLRCRMPSPLAAAHSDAALGERSLSFVGKFVFCYRLLVRRHDKSLRNKLIKNLSFIRIQIRAPSLQNIAEDRNFLVSDKGVCHYTLLTLPARYTAYLDPTTTLSTCWHRGHSKVRRSNPGSSNVMRARYISAAHFGHCGRALIGAFSSVYSENVICDPSCHRRECHRTKSYRRLTVTFCR